MPQPQPLASGGASEVDAGLAVATGGGAGGLAGPGMRGAAASADPAPPSRWKAIGARGAGGGTAGGKAEVVGAGAAERPSERVGPGAGGGPHTGETEARGVWGCTLGTPVHALDAHTWWLLTERRSTGHPPSSPGAERGLAS